MTHSRAIHAVCAIVLGILVLGAVYVYAGASPQVREHEPVHLEGISGSELKRVVITRRAYERLGIETLVTRASVYRLPFSSIVYDVDGSAWIYVTEEPLAYQRRAVQVRFVTDDNVAVLGAPVPVGTTVVTIGVMELFGAEHGVGTSSK